MGFSWEGMGAGAVLCYYTQFHYVFFFFRANPTCYVSCRAVFFGVATAASVLKHFYPPSIYPFFHAFIRSLVFVPVDFTRSSGYRVGQLVTCWLVCMSICLSVCLSKMEPWSIVAVKVS